MKIFLFCIEVYIDFAPERGFKDTYELVYAENEEEALRKIKEKYTETYSIENCTTF